MSSSNGQHGRREREYGAAEVNAFARRRLYRFQGGPSEPWVEWGPHSDLEPEYEDFFEALDQPPQTPSGGATATHSARLNPFPDPRYVNHLLVAGEVRGRDLYDSVIEEVGAAVAEVRAGKGALHGLITSLAAMRDELQRQVSAVEHQINEVVGAVRDVIKVWVAEEWERLHRDDSEGAEREWRRVRSDAADVWARFSEVWGAATYDEDPDPAEIMWIDPEEALKWAPWSSADPLVATCTSRALLYYYEELRPRWQEAATLDLRRYAYDTCIHALLQGRDLPAWKGMAQARRPFEALAQESEEERARRILLIPRERMRYVEELRKQSFSWELVYDELLRHWQSVDIEAEFPYSDHDSLSSTYRQWRKRQRNDKSRGERGGGEGD